MGLVIIARRDRERGIRALRFVGAQQIGLVVGHVVAARDLLDEVAVVAPGAGVVIIVADLVDLRRGGESRPLQPEAFDINDIIGARPHLEVGALVHPAAGGGQVVGLRGLVREDVRVAHREFLEGDGADLVHRGHAGPHHGGAARGVGIGGQAAAEIALAGVGGRRLLAGQDLGETGRTEQQACGGQKAGKGIHI